MPAYDDIEAGGRKRQLFGVGHFETNSELMLTCLLPRLDNHRWREINADDTMSAGRQFEAQKTGATADIERVECAGRREDQIEHTVPGSALSRRADAINPRRNAPLAGSNERRPVL